MRRASFRSCFPGIFCVLALAIAPVVPAATLSLTTSWYADASGTAQLGSATTGSFTSVSATNGYTYGQQVQNTAGHAFSSSASGLYGFDDAYAFTLSGPVTANSITATLNLGSLLNIQNLQVRLFKYSGGAPIALSGDTGLPAGGIGPAIPGWTPMPTGTGWVTIFSDTNLDPGTYVFEVRGLATGSAGGTYSGALQVGPVPIPPAFTLLLSALGAFGTFAWRRAGALLPSGAAAS